jgi:hypothetical protein
MSTCDIIGERRDHRRVAEHFHQLLGDTRHAATSVTDRLNEIIARLDAERNKGALIDSEWPNR